MSNEMGLRSDQRGEGFIYVMRSIDPDLYNRIKVGLSVDPVVRSQQLSNTSTAFSFTIYRVWAVNDMAYAESVAHRVLSDHRVAGNREFFDIIPQNQRWGVTQSFEPPTVEDIDCCLYTLTDNIDTEFKQNPKIKHYNVDNSNMYEYSRQRKITNRNPNNPNRFGPLFD